MNMVAFLKNSTSPPPNCDRYGHPLRDTDSAPANQALERYLSEQEDQVTERWSQLYRNLYEDRGVAVSQEELMEVIQTTLHGLCQDPANRLPATFADGLRRRVQQRICLAGWECHGYLVPTQDWEDRDDLNAVRAALKRKLLGILDHLIA